MAKKYKLNINGSPAQNVNFNGSAWTGPLVANGVDVSYEDAPVAPPPPSIPQPDTVWKFSAAPIYPYDNYRNHSLGFNVRGPLDARTPAGSAPLFQDVYPFIDVSGNLIRAGSHVLMGAAPVTTSAAGGNLSIAGEAAQVSYGTQWKGKWVGIVAQNGPVGG